MTQPDAAGSATTGPAPGRDRSYALALVLLAVGAGALLLSAGRVWASAAVGGAGLPTLAVAVTGSDVAPALSALAVLALAGVAGLVATRSRGRVVVGALLVLAGAGTAWIAVQFALTASGATGAGATIAQVVAERTGSPAGAVVVGSLWWLVALLGGVLVAAAGVLALLRGGGWPQMGRRYERDGAQPAAPGPRAARPESAWDQLDRGVDPTLDADTDADADPDADTDTAPRSAPADAPANAPVDEAAAGAGHPSAEAPGTGDGGPAGTDAAATARPGPAPRTGSDMMAPTTVEEGPR